MAITRTQQARQMLKTAGAVEQDGVMNYIKNSESVTVPKEFKARENATPTKLAYITKDEAKMLKKMKKGTPHKGPKGIPSYDDFDAETGSFTSGAAMSAAETGGKTERDRADLRAAGISPEDARDLRSAAIAAGAGQRVNPGFFDSRNLVSPVDLAAAKAFAPQAFRRSRGGGLLGFLTSGGILGNLVRGVGQRLGFGKRFNQPSVDMSRFRNLPLGGSAAFQNLDIRDKYNRLDTDDEDENINLNDYQGLTNLDFINRISESDMSLTPEQRQLIEDEQVGDIREIMAADGGMIGGGIMDAAGRQNYFLGKLVKKATRAVKKIAKSPVGKIGLGALLLGGATGGFGADGFLRDKALPFLLENKGLAAAAGLIAAPLIFGNQEDDSATTLQAPGRNINPLAYTNPREVLFPAFRSDGSPKEGEKGNMKIAGYLDPMSEKNDMAMEMFGKQLKDLTDDELELLDEEIQRLRSKFMAEGGSTEKEPVAKKTMPLLDMGGQEMDLRAEGGFVPIGRMEKADDVPARLSKNEFVFTADAVRNAGDGDVDKGAEVMYNMMKNLEAGGEVSEESQGLEGARKMFQTSQRLGEVV